MKKQYKYTQEELKEKAEKMMELFQEYSSDIKGYPEYRIGYNFIEQHYYGYRNNKYVSAYWTEDMGDIENAFSLERLRDLVSAGLSYIDVIANHDYDEDYIKNEEDAKKEIKNTQEEILKIKKKYGDHFWLFNDHDTAGIEMVLEYKI